MRRALLQALALLVGISGLGNGLAAQQTGQTPPPTQEERRKARLDSLQARMADRLLVLARGPGADSAIIASDSARLAAAVRRPAARGGGLQATDSVTRILLELDGYVATLYSGTQATFDQSTGLLTLVGDTATKARTQRAGEAVEADSAIVYDEDRGVVRTRGMTTLQPTDGSPLTTPRLFFNLNDQSASAVSARTTLDQGAEWYMNGDLPLIYTEGGYGHNLTFTTCELEHPHYHFSAKEVKWSRGEDSVLVARNVVLKFGEVPVFWFPFFAQNIGSGRRSGILTPTFSVNDIVRTSGSYERRISNVGYYWAINDYMGGSLAMDWFSGNYTAVTGSFSYSWLRQFLRGSLSARRYWESDGGTQLALSTSHNWEISERTRFTARARYASSTSFVTQNSFDPAEVTSSIDSEGGLTRRFDFGTLSLSGNRRQFLSDDRVETSFPDASLSLRTVTLLQAPASSARWYNNLSVGGNLQFSARSTDRAEEPGVYIRGQEDRSTMRGSASLGLNLGGFSLPASLSFERGVVRGIPRDSIPFFADVLAEQGAGALISRQGIQALDVDPVLGELEDLSRTTVDWSIGTGFQQTLISTTTLTPSVSVTGSLLRSDTVSAAQNFVAGPTRVSMGAQLRSDLYGFYPGFGSYEALRHKVSPTFSYDYAPEVTPTDLQRRVFGAGVTQTRNVMALSLNQTFEAKRRVEEDDSATMEGTGGAEGAGAGTEAGAGQAVGGTGTVSLGGSQELRRLEQGEIVSLLALRTSAIRYDFVEADSTGRLLDGFTTTSLTNTISSDLLADFTVTVQHDLFGGDPESGRSFDPKLTRLNFGFDLDNRSPILGIFGLFGDDDGESPTEGTATGGGPAPERDDPFDFGTGTDDSVVPGDESEQRSPARSGSGTVGDWGASLTYALTRGREPSDLTSQTLQARFRLQPTELWQMSWNTAYDIDQGSFNDHVITLSRDLHRWTANFDFVQTATGNWSFRFEVRLTDQEDLKFDYEQRSVRERDFFGDFGRR